MTAQRRAAILVRAATERSRARRGQGGFVILAGLMVWLTVGGVAMVALLSMTTSATMQANQQATRAQQLRALDAALETAVVEVQVDPSGRVGQPTGKDDPSCEAELGPAGKGLVYDDGMGNTVTVTSACSGSTKKSEPHLVRLTARLTAPGAASTTVGGATLEVVKAKGPGNEVTVLDWSLTAPPADLITPTTTPTTTPGPATTTIPATTSTTTPTTTSTTPTGVSWSSRVTSEWQSGYCVEVTVTNNNRNTEKWTVQVPVKGTIYAFWNATNTRSGDTLTVVGEKWNQSLKSGESTTFGWCSNF